MIDNLDDLKTELREEIKSLYFEDRLLFLKKRFKWLFNRYMNVKKKALDEVMEEVFIESEDDFLKNLMISASNINVLLEIKYKFINFGSVVGPMMRFLLPIILSFGALLLTINSIEDINVKYLFGISYPTFLTYLISIILIGILVSLFYTKIRNKRIFALYINERIEYIIYKLIDDKAVN